MVSLNRYLVACSVLSRSIIITMAEDCSICAEGETLTKPRAIINLVDFGLSENECGVFDNLMKRNGLSVSSGTTCVSFYAMTKEPCGCRNNKEQQDEPQQQQEEDELQQQENEPQPENCNICAKGEIMTNPESIVDLSQIGLSEQECGFADNWFQTNQLPTDTGMTCSTFNAMTKEPCGCIAREEDVITEEEDCSICAAGEILTKPTGIVDLSQLGYSKTSCGVLNNLAITKQLPTDMKCPILNAMTKEPCGCVCNNICEEGETMTKPTGIVNLSQFGSGEQECSYLDTLVKSNQRPISGLTCMNSQALTKKPCGCMCNNICGEGKTMTKPTGFVNLDEVGYGFGEQQCSYLDSLAKTNQLPTDTGLTCANFNALTKEPCGCLDNAEVDMTNNDQGSNQDGSNENTNNDTCNNVCGEGKTMTKPTAFVNLEEVGYGFGEQQCSYFDLLAKSNELLTDNGLTCATFNALTKEPCGCLDNEDVDMTNNDQGSNQDVSKTSDGSAYNNNRNNNDIVKKNNNSRFSDAIGNDKNNIVLSTGAIVGFVVGSVAFVGLLTIAFYSPWNTTANDKPIVSAFIVSEEVENGQSGYKSTQPVEII